MTSENYYRYLEKVIRAAASKKHGIRLSDLVAECAGAFPTDVFQVANSLGVAVSLDVDWTEEEDATQFCLPEPHPADFDWRFSRASREWLAEKIMLTLKDVGKRVLLLGAPTLFAELKRRGCDAVLVDKNALTVQVLARSFPGSVLEKDFATPLQNIGSFDVVVADPPWYVDHYRWCFERGEELCTDCGVFLVSVLPWLTRPSAVEDRRAILHFASRAFDLVTVTAGSLTYSTPPFERAALLRSGLNCRNWRKGDLFEFIRIPSADGSRGSESVEGQVHSGENWISYQLPGDLHVKIRAGVGKVLRPFSYSLIGGEPTLASVSRRYPHRNRIDVWTSDNRALEVSNSAIATELIKLVSEGRSLESSLDAIRGSAKLNQSEYEELAHFGSVILAR